MSNTFIHFLKPGENNPGYIQQMEPPYIIGKVIKFLHQPAAEDYAAKQVQYYIGRVTGYNIFIAQAGFMQPPTRNVPDVEIKTAIDDMCYWYYENKVEGKKIVIKKFQTR